MAKSSNKEEHLKEVEGDSYIQGTHIRL